MGYKLYRQIRDFAPQDWTSGELVVALMIADSANDGTRRSYLTPPDLSRRARMTDRGVRKALERLTERGFEFRVCIGKDSNGKEIYGIPGKTIEYQVPDIFMALERGAAVAYGLVDKLAGGGTAVPPIAGLSTEPRRYHSTGKAVPRFRLWPKHALILTLKPAKPPQLKTGNCPHTCTWKRARTQELSTRSMMTQIAEQPMPVPNSATDIQSLVIADIVTRREVGIQRYGTPLQPHNGRDALRDAYEEALDLAMYLRQAIAERDQP